MQMSNRISAFQCSPIRRLVPYAREAAEKGIHVIHLNIGQPDIKTPKEALDAIHNYGEDIIEQYNKRKLKQFQIVMEIVAVSIQMACNLIQIIRY